MAKSLKQLKEEYVSTLESIIENLQLQRDILSEDEITEGIVYVLRQVGTNNYKIGLTRNFVQRKYNFDIKLPFEVEEIYTFRSENYRELERALHQEFESVRLNGSEFFALNDELIKGLPALVDKLEKSFSVSIEITKDKKAKDDELVEKAKELVTQYGKISTSFLQRKLGIGYSRAAKIKDILLLPNDL